MPKRIEVTVPDELFETLERLRGDVSRQRWMLRTVEMAVGLLENVDTAGVAKATGIVQSVARKIEMPVAQRVSPNVPLVPAGMFRCRSCEFTAQSPKAHCPHHGGALIPV